MNKMELLLEAIYFASNKHKNQRRKDSLKTPYINHPIEVCFILSNCGITDEKILMAAVLHDTIEDTETTFEELNSIFGEIVTKMVMECSDEKNSKKECKKQIQIEKANSVCVGSKLIKLADKYSNLSNLINDPPELWSEQEIKGYFYWCYAIFLKLKGTNEILENKLIELFKKKNVFGINEKKLESELVEYYKNIKNSD